ncbi:GNAT family N-acetyltransferase [Limosilactobacillus fermentum]|uniref:N-acetyltransferase domain-containing protein n=1 Tax=Limosilactobacillus fermentum TaxID=1613 RepID=A0ABD0AJD4_LIMFE|nr:GNAT family N-acetyltransferase [Limosilactobacillus fermentum]GIC71389.1 hypothetical protein LF01B1_04040 [Limosilactobacillus fermentum]
MQADPQKQLDIRLVTEADMGFVNQCFSDPQLVKEVGLTLSDNPSARQWAFAMWRQSGDFWVITLGESRVGLATSFVIEKGVREVGYLILRPWQGRGLMTKVLQILISNLRAGGQTKRVEAQTWGDNYASATVLARNGFIRTGENEAVVNWCLELS